MNIIVSTIKKLPFKKLLLLSGFFFVIGYFASFMQQKYYGYMDANGVIHDSLWLPIAAISTVLAGVLFIIWCVITLITSTIGKQQKNNVNN